MYCHIIYILCVYIHIIIFMLLYIWSMSIAVKCYWYGNIYTCFCCCCCFFPPTSAIYSQKIFENRDEERFFCTHKLWLIIQKEIWIKSNAQSDIHFFDNSVQQVIGRWVWVYHQKYHLSSDNMDVFLPRAGITGYIKFEIIEREESKMLHGEFAKWR